MTTPEEKRKEFETVVRPVIDQGEPTGPPKLQ
jgi:hypothetical protein